MHQSQNSQTQGAYYLCQKMTYARKMRAITDSHEKTRDVNVAMPNWVHNLGLCLRS
jgi:hypothetical protein